MIVGICAYNRPDHLAAVLHGLHEQAARLNALYIYCDGPKAGDETLCEQVREIANSVDWTDCIVTEYDRNRGLKRSVIGTMDHMLIDMAYKDAVLLEDDCAPGPHFLHYMKACLDKYRNHDTVLGISGYTVPIPADVRKEYPWSNYFVKRVGSWGWATWSDRWELLERDLDKAVQQIGVPAVATVGRDMVGYTARATTGLDVWTPNWQMTALRQDAFYSYPVVSHVANIGFDGSGTCKVNSSRYESPIAKRWPVKRLAPGVVCHPETSDAFRRYYPL